MKCRIPRLLCRIACFFEGVSKHKIIKEKDSLYVFILAYNESLFFE